MLHHNLNKDLDTRRTDIADYLATEIVTRYYNQPGSIAYGLRNDIVLDSVENMLDTPGRYKQILSPR